MRSTIDDDELLIATMLAPPPLEQSRDSLEYWRRRRSALPVYRRGARRECDRMIGRWRARVLEAERLRYGTGILGFVRRLFAGEPPPWRLTARGLVGLGWWLLPGRLRLVASAFVAAWVLAGVLTLAAIAYLLA
jgi:hypothetical protein